MKKLFKGCAVFVVLVVVLIVAALVFSSSVSNTSTDKTQKARAPYEVTNVTCESGYDRTLLRFTVDITSQSFTSETFLPDGRAVAHTNSTEYVDDGSAWTVDFVNANETTTSEYLFVIHEVVDSVSEGHVMIDDQVRLNFPNLRCT